jgi:hypothetical protein
MPAQTKKPRGYPPGSPCTLHDQRVPPRMGPQKRIRDTILWAIPFAKPIRWGGDTKKKMSRVDPRLPNDSGQRQLTVVQQNGDGGVAESDTTEADGCANREQTHYDGVTIILGISEYSVERDGQISRNE